MKDDNEQISIICSVLAHRHLNSGILKVELEISPRDVQEFFRHFTYTSPDGKRPACLVPIQRDVFDRYWGKPFETHKPPVEVERDRSFVNQLHSTGFFRNPHVHEAVGTDDEFLDWIRLQPSALSGRHSEYVDGEGRCEAAHVRRASNSGVGMKPRYSAIPLTRKEHALQHAEGEPALGKSVGKLTDKEWYRQKAMFYVSSWAKERIKRELGRKSFSDVSLSEFMDWAEQKGLEKHVPVVVRDEHDEQKIR